MAHDATSTHTRARTHAHAHTQGTRTTYAKNQKVPIIKRFISCSPTKIRRANKIIGRSKTKTIWIKTGVAGL